MSPQQVEPAPSDHVQSRFGQVARSATGAVIAAVTGPVAVVAVGLIAWVAVRGIPGILIAGVVGDLVGGTLRGLGNRATRLLAGGLGGVAGGYFAIATAEVSPPGTVEWAIRGGMTGMAVAAVIGVVLGAVGGLAHPRA